MYICIYFKHTLLVPIDPFDSYTTVIILVAWYQVVFNQTMFTAHHHTRMTVVVSSVLIRSAVGILTHQMLICMDKLKSDVNRL